VIRNRAESAPLERLAEEPAAFDFDAAVALIWRARGGEDPGEAMRFRTRIGLAYPEAEVESLRAGPHGVPELTVTPFGLTGATGVLPRYWSEQVVQSVRGRSHALHDFVDLFGHRLTALFAAAGAKYRPHRAADHAPPEARLDRTAEALLAVTGYGTPHLAERFPAGLPPLLHYSGYYSLRPRSAERLRALVSDWLGRAVAVVQFVGTWLPVPPDQQTRLPRGRLAGAFGQLGVDAAAGSRAWDPQGRFVLRIGPLPLAEFRRLLPGTPGLRDLVALTRAFVGPGMGFAVNLILRRQDVPSVRLGGDGPPPRLGWDTWLPTASRTRDADEPMFEAEVVERA
jgi:type VI secretion system protein ImpH